MDLNPEDIAAALATNPGPQAPHPLWDAYWKEVGRWAPFLGMAIPSPSGTAAAVSAIGKSPGYIMRTPQWAIDEHFADYGNLIRKPRSENVDPYEIAKALQKAGKTANDNLK